MSLCLKSGIVKTGNEAGVTRCRMIVAGTIFLIPVVRGTVSTDIFKRAEKRED